MKIILCTICLLCSCCRCFCQAYTDDLAVVSIISPPAFMDSSSFTTVTLSIKNMGTEEQANFPLRYWYDGFNPISVTEIYPLSILPGEIKTYNFITQLDLSNPNCYKISACTLLPGDQNPANDTKTINTWVPDYPIITKTVYPSPDSLWTGTTDSLNFTQSSLVQFAGDGSKQGWMMFNLDSIPAASSVLAVQLKVNTLAPFTSTSFMLKQALINPLFANPALVYDSIDFGLNYLYCNDTSLPGQQLTFDLPQTAICDLQTALFSTGYFTVGVRENTNDTANKGTFAGWDQVAALKPSLTVKYVSLLVQDIGILSIDVDTSANIYGEIVPMVRVHNYGFIEMDFLVSINSNVGYSCSKYVSGIAPGATLQVELAPWTAVSGPVCFYSHIFNSADQNCSNDMASLCWDNTFPPAVYGNVSYKNYANTRLRDSTIVLLMPYNPPGLILIDTVDANGNYLFENVAPGTYNLQVFSEKAWGGANAMDCLAVLKHFVGMTMLTGLNLKAADVNHDGFINSVDALMIQRRFIGAIPGFPAGDWVSDQPFVTIPSASYVPVNLKVLCTGDVNGSHLP